MVGVGLIPAHAGKTSRSPYRDHPSRAHPRSRGENVIGTFVAGFRAGSSPLTRGKRLCCADDRLDLGLIPAHAGKTSLTSPTSWQGWAHPRSRGENEGQGHCLVRRRGSSPLTRGKQPSWTSTSCCWGLIPAHAGKTSSASTCSTNPGAHPRSRGENSYPRRRSGQAGGSSPLTRGKHRQSSHRCRGRGLIPAHAGKTLPDLRFYRADRSDLGKP